MDMILRRILATVTTLTMARRLAVYYRSGPFTHFCQADGDLLASVLHELLQETCRGPVTLTEPEPEPKKDYCRVLPVQL